MRIWIARLWTPHHPHPRLAVGAARKSANREGKQNKKKKRKKSQQIQSILIDSTPDDQHSIRTSILTIRRSLEPIRPLRAVQRTRSARPVLLALALVPTAPPTSVF